MLLSLIRTQRVPDRMQLLQLPGWLRRAVPAEGRRAAVGAGEGGDEGEGQ